MIRSDSPIAEVRVVEVDLKAFLPVPRSAGIPLSEARVESDGDDWGVIAIDEAQLRLEKEDDFAILQLGTSFKNSDDLLHLRIQVNSVGLRTLEVDGTYCVPARGEAPEGFDRYKLPSPLPSGEHRVEWSYVWNPPKDLESGEALEDGVTLVAPRLIGPATGDAQAITALPESVDATQLDKALPTLSPEDPLDLLQTVELPASAKHLEIDTAADGIPSDGISATIDGEELALASTEGSICRWAIGPGMSPGEVQLAIALPKIMNLKSVRWVS